VKGRLLLQCLQEQVEGLSPVATEQEGVGVAGSRIGVVGKAGREALPEVEVGSVAGSSVSDGGSSRSSCSRNSSAVSYRLRWYRITLTRCS
jgi:hypothetical protein